METPLERGGRLGRRYVVVVFGVLATAFMLSTTAQLTAGVFGVHTHPLDAESTLAGRACAGKLRDMEAAVERAIVASVHAPGEAEASLQYEGALLPEWGDAKGVESHCGSVAEGADALATVLRLRVAGEQLVRRHAREMAPLRRDVASYLPREARPNSETSSTKPGPSQEPNTVAEPKP
jgi:hypothetical protein